MNLYLLLKTLHVSTALISVVLFSLRFALAYSGRSGWRRGILRWLPHANDTVLLSAAVGLCLITGWMPLTHHWLTAKLFLLLGYIIAGKAALAANSSRRRRLFAGALAALQIGLIFLLAVIKPTF